MKKALVVTRYEDVIGDCTKKINGNSIQTASFRLQGKPLIQALIRSNYDYNAISLSTNNPETLELIQQPDIAIFTKINSSIEMQNNLAMSNLAALARLKCKGVPILCVYSDNLASLEDYPTGEFHRNLLFMSDFIICPSKRLAHESKKFSRDKTPTFVIADPWQVRQELAFKKLEDKSLVKLLWFGQGSNLTYLLKILPELTQCDDGKRKTQITILADFNSLNIITAFWRKLPRNNSWTCRTVLWDKQDQPAQLERELLDAHITILPSDPSDSRKCGVSHNRVVDSIRGGCIPIASPMDSYKEIKHSCIIAENFRESIQFTLSNYNKMASHLNLTRGHALQQFSPDENRKNWDSVLKFVISTTKKV